MKDELDVGAVVGQPHTGAADMPAANVDGPRRLRRWWTWIAYGALLASVAAIVMVSLLALPPDALLRAMAWLRGASHLGVLLQIALCAWIIARWSRLIAWARRRGLVTKAEHRDVLAMRWRAAALLGAYLLAVPIGPARLLVLFA
ncbi:hypothetical protein [Xylophilus sp. ASV27]|uniref:hypothetical protein n=1 Tax=Xylophilus sp. ASV27 TaxID=2795129 RepID=UPI001E6566D8|nr:hypothetical protein [Xylophilus sp. ASV27]